MHGSRAFSDNVPTVVCVVQLDAVQLGGGLSLPNLAMYYYTAIERFDSGNAERWEGFTRWLGRSDLKRLVTLDHTLCPTVVHPQSADDWLYVAKEEFMIDFFTDLNLVLRHAASRRPSVVIAVARDPALEEVDGFPRPDFELAGFDVVDVQFTGSVIFSPKRFPGTIDISQLSPDSGLIPSRDSAFEARDALRRRYPNREDAHCAVWAVWRYLGPAASTTGRRP